MSSFQSLGVLLAFVAGTASTLAQTTASLPNVTPASTMIRADNTFFAQGSGGLYVGNANATMNPPLLLNAIFVFNVSAVPAGNIFTSATLSFFQSPKSASQGVENSAGYDLYFCGYSSDTATFPAETAYKANDIDQPTGDGIRVADNLFGFTSTNNQVVTTSGLALVTALNTRSNSTTLGNYAFFRVNMDAVDPAVKSYINLANLPPNPGSYPQLTVTYGLAPEPSSLLTLALATSGLGGALWRRAAR